MSLFDNCPLTIPLPSIPKQVCGQNYNQIQKIALWEKGQTPFTTTSILTSAAWTTAATATDATKVIVTNYLTNFLIPNSTSVEQTADTNINAIPELQRGSIVKGTFNSRSLSADEISAMQALTPYTQIQPGVSSLVFVMINNANQVIYNANGTDLGFPIYNLFTSDNDIQATLGALNMVTSEFYLTYGWSKTQAIGQVSFDLLNTYPAA
jgi:hypothetical protein